MLFARAYPTFLYYSGIDSTVIWDNYIAWIKYILVYSQVENHVACASFMVSKTTMDFYD